MQRKDVTARLAKISQIPALCDLSGNLLYLVRAYATRFGHAGQLGVDGSRTQMRIEAAGTGGEQISRDRTCEVRILLAKLLDRRLHAIGQLLAGGVQGRAGRSGGIVIIVVCVGPAGVGVLLAPAA